MKCQHCEKDVPALKKTCPHCGQETGSKPAIILHQVGEILKKIGLLLKKAFLYLMEKIVYYSKKAYPHIKKFLSVKRNRIITAATLGVLIVTFVVLGLIRRPDQQDPVPTLVLSDPVVELEQNVPFTGSVLSIDELTSPIYGFEMVVPFGAYDVSTPFEISTQTIESHDFGDTFEPITPLITIDNGHVFSNETLTVTIPIEIAEDEFAMGFYYDPETGALEGIPMNGLTSTSITLFTRHFSSIVISKITIEDLLRLSSATDKYVDTGFTPGVDDWQFTNYGSFVAPGGHCAGQVLTMSWYYHTQKIGNDEPALYNLFDNVNDEPTVGFTEDDAYGYRFASVIQDLLDFESSEFYDYLVFGDRDDALVYYAFSYAMVMTERPQLMAIYAFDDFGSIISGHAILAYRMSGYKIYVADPNYPGQDDRYVEYDTSYSVQAFKPYSSGANAQAILNDGALQYEGIYYIGESALIDYETIESEYEKVLDGTIGDDVFPTLEAAYLTDYNQDAELHVWDDVIDDEITLGTDHNGQMACFLQNKVVIAATTGHPDSVFTIYQGDQLIEGPYIAADDGYVYVEIDLTNGSNDIGILAEIAVDDALYYADFMRIEVDYEAGVTTPCAATIVGRYDFYSRSDGQQLVQNHYIQINQDGTFTESYTTNDTLYTNTINGTWTIEPGQNAGENILYLTFGSQTDTYEVLENYLWLRYTSGDLIFLFRKNG